MSDSEKCTACHRTGVDYHHIKTRKSGGGDDYQNLIPLCREHHVMVHTEGMNRLAAKYFKVKKWLGNNGWEFNPYLKKWVKK